jgi:hypothetical protein
MPVPLTLYLPQLGEYIEYRTILRKRRNFARHYAKHESRVRHRFENVPEFRNNRFEQVVVIIYEREREPESVSIAINCPINDSRSSKMLQAILLIANLSRTFMNKL